LRARYRSGDLTPSEVIGSVYARIAARGVDHVWISLVSEDDAHRAAAALDSADLDDQPLWGIPFGVKDNIDVAGLVTTAACPDFGYVATATAPVVARLLAAGAILIGKTNLDQFATGLNGTRSPYGAPASVADPELISGGSSSGSAVAVAAGLVSFAVGTDTAGSGRVPAALNGVVGVKPSIGLLSTTGVVPACRSLDCPSVFAGSVQEAAVVLSVTAGYDAADPWSRRLKPPAVPVGVPTLAGLRLAVPAEFEQWGERGEQDAWHARCDLLRSRGADLVPIDLSPFAEAGRQLYQGPWVAERLDGLEEFLAERGDGVHPVTREILELGVEVRGVDTFAALTRMAHLKNAAYDLLAGFDALLTPTVTETFTIAEMLADPIELNGRLGMFTAFTNLLDLCALAVPAGETGSGVPFGVTLQATAGRDQELLGLASCLESELSHGAVSARAVTPGEARGSLGGLDVLELAVVGAHLRGLPLHEDLRSRGAELIERTTTAPSYRLFALADTSPPKPGLRRVSQGGTGIEVEVYRLPRQEVGDFLATVRAPLAIGQVTLADGREVHGFVCEAAGFESAVDITRYGGWRAYLAATAFDDASRGR
jgi:allophanate hydrolase